MSQARKIELVASSPPIGDGAEVTFRLPRPISGDTLDRIAVRLIQKTGVRPDDSVHLIAVANSGVAIASMALAKMSTTSMVGEAWLSVVNPHALNDTFIRNPTPKHGKRLRTIVVDNSIKTGATMESVLRLLQNRGITADSVVKLVQYRSDADSSIITFFESYFQVTVTSLFDQSEVLAVTDSISALPAAQS